MTRLLKTRTFHTFDRIVRRHQVVVSPELPLSFVQEGLRRGLTEKAKHSIIECSWKDETGSVDLMRDVRVVSVGYVPSGQRHGLGASVELDPIVSRVRFARASR